MFMEVYSVIKKWMQIRKKESDTKESEEDDATKNSFACRETKWSVKNNNR